jgi:hypothetical protein
MSMSAIRAGLIFLLWIAFSIDVAAQDFNQQQINEYRNSVVRVDATGCAGVSGGRLVGSGFLWKQNSWVVTALHVVNGCQSLSVYSDTASDAASAHISKILFAEDLALLSLDRGINGTVALTKAKAAPQDTEDILLVGFPGDSSGSTGKTVKRQFTAGNTLANIASYEAQQELKQTQSPALNITVIFLQGILEHGHSGGPILNHDGDVIAVADGGLKHGTTEDSWAIPSEQLAALENSQDPLAKMVLQRSDLLFAALPTGNSEPAVLCGGGNFKHFKTVGYSDVLITTDDAAGLQQLVAASGMDPTTFAFEVFQDLQTGATVVLPKGETLSVNGDTCLATSGGGGVMTHVKLLDATADPTGQTSSIKFETEVMGLNPTWVLAQAFSYLHPLPVAGGGVSLRKNWVHYLLLPGIPQQLNFQQFDAAQFETVALRRGALLGVAALNTRWSPSVVQTQQACRINAQVSPYCAQALQDLREWIESTLAVHLSTLAGT